jgi:hypothetical protein
MPNKINTLPNNLAARAELPEKTFKVHCRLAKQSIDFLPSKVFF